MAESTRPTEQKPFDAETSRRINHIRAVSAFMVFVFHYQHFVASSFFFQLNSFNPISILAYHGYIGVSLFFCLSGFLFSKVYSNKVRLNVVSFYEKRVLRIFPAFILVCITYVVIQNEGLTRFFTLLSYIFYFNTQVYPYELGHLWSVNRELECYAMFPFLWGVYHYFGKVKLVVVYTLMLFAALYLGLVKQDPLPFFYNTLWLRAEEFVLGMLAGLYYKKITINRLYFICWLLIFVCVLVTYHRAVWIAPLNYPVYGVLGLVGCGFFSIVGIVLYLSSDRSLPYQINKILDFFGKISYSFYLFHFFIMSYIMSNYRDMLGEGLARFALILISCTVVAVVSYYVAELPGLKLKKIIKKNH